MFKEQYFGIEQTFKLSIICKHFKRLYRYDKYEKIHLKRYLIN